MLEPRRDILVTLLLSHAWWIALLDRPRLPFKAVQPRFKSPELLVKQALEALSFFLLFNLLLLITPIFEHLACLVQLRHAFADPVTHGGLNRRVESLQLSFNRGDVRTLLLVEGLLQCFCRVLGTVALGLDRTLGERKTWHQEFRHFC